MGSEHLDRQPPRDAAEEREQDRIMREGAEGAPTDLPTAVPAEAAGADDGNDGNGGDAGEAGEADSDAHSEADRRADG
jgi:hypothetical protein